MSYDAPTGSTIDDWGYAEAEAILDDWDYHSLPDGELIIWAISKGLQAIRNCHELGLDGINDEPVDKLIYGIHESDIDQIIEDMIRDEEINQTPPPEQMQRIYDAVADKDWQTDYEIIQILIDDIIGG